MDRSEGEPSIARKPRRPSTWEDTLCFVREGRRRRLRDGETALRREGAVVDDALGLEIRPPGSDQRHGVSVVARPPRAIRACIAEHQRRLKSLDPRQYFYPLDDLHLTLVEVAQDVHETDVARIVATAKRVLSGALGRVGPINLAAPQIMFDAHGIALEFLASNRSLDQTRDHVILELEKADVRLRPPRYAAHTAHVTFLRYVNPLAIDIETWIHHINANADLTMASWTISQLWLTWGVTWYGMRSRIRTRPL